MESIGSKIATGAIWMVAFKFAQRGLGLISTVILARLLLPEDFGVVALAMSVVLVVELIGAFSFDIALIQNQQAQRHHYDTAWTLNIFLGIFFALTISLLAIPMAAFYSEPRLELIMYIIAVGIFIEQLQNIGIVAFRKDMEFDKEFNFMISKKIVSFVVTVPLAIYFRNYWALIVGIFSGYIAGTILSYLWHPYRPRFSLIGARDLFNFSKWMVLNNIFGTLRFRSADFIVGKIANAHTLGIYNVAYEIANLVTTELIAPINRAVFPGYAKMSHSLESLRKGYLDVISVITIISLPAALGIAVTAEHIVMIMLGDKWVETIPIIQILSLMGAVLAIQSNSASIFMALGVPRVLTLLFIGTFLLTIPIAIWLTMRNGAIGTAIAYCAVTIIFLPISFFLVIKTLRMKPSQLLATLYRPVTATAVMVAVVYFYLKSIRPFDGIWNNIFELVTGSVLGAILYIGSIYLLWSLAGKPEGAEEILLSKVKPFIKKKIWSAK